jgi:hypothetical protein
VHHHDDCVRGGPGAADRGQEGLRVRRAEVVPGEERDRKAVDFAHDVPTFDRLEALGAQETPRLGQAHPSGVEGMVVRQAEQVKSGLVEHPRCVEGEMQPHRIGWHGLVGDGAFEVADCQVGAAQGVGDMGEDVRQAFHPAAGHDVADGKDLHNRLVGGRKRAAAQVDPAAGGGGRGRRQRRGHQEREGTPSHLEACRTRGHLANEVPPKPSWRGGLRPVPGGG